MTRHAILLLGLLLSFLGVSILGLILGAVPIPVWEVLSALTGSADPQVETIVLGLRLPRVLLAAEVGAGLAVAGAVFQALLRNPLAEPYILGVSSGAAVGAVMAIILGMTVNSMFALPVAAFLGAVLAIILVLAMARAAGRGLDTHVLLLAGVVIGAFFNAVVLLL
ncbi:MAG: iron ABC transporter, partial [Myxococcales bacterium]|nr:iron ABC transporter [Myxococcales bacterium]